jgi:hypothetical protein
LNDNPHSQLVERKKFIAILAVAILLVPVIILLQSGGGSNLPPEEVPSQVWVKKLVEDTKTVGAVNGSRIYIGRVNQFSLEDDIINIAATPMLFMGGSYNPLILKAGGNEDATNRFIALSTLEAEDLPHGDAGAATSAMAMTGWKSSDAVMLVANIDDALKAAPLAAFLKIPMLLSNGTQHEDAAKAATVLGAEYCIAVGDARRLDMQTMRLPSEQINDFHLWCMEHAGVQCNYMIVTNPRDMYNYSWGAPDRIPIPYLSLLSAQLAAYRQAPIFYTKGLKTLGQETASPEFVQMGASAEEVNKLAENTRDVVKSGKMLIESRGGGGDGMYLAMVGGPVALPFYYEYEASSDGETTFSNTDFIASDYYYGDLDEDYQMELAVGRIIGRNIEDASTLIARTLMEGSRDFTYENDGDVSQNLYDTMAGPWQGNSAVYIGTTRTGPMPGCLKHAKSYQVQTMQGGGFTPTALENFKANTQTVSETMDKVQYSVYYGHGDIDCWWSNRGDYITGETVASARLKPGVAIAMACLTARVDNAQNKLSTLISLGFLHGGFNSYIGATRLAYGLVELYDSDSLLPVTDTDALYLVDRFTWHITNEDMDVGMALMHARNELMQHSPDSFGSEVAMWEYVLYGDPAYNMHVPAIDGTV